MMNCKILIWLRSVELSESENFESRVFNLDYGVSGEDQRGKEELWKEERKSRMIILCKWWTSSCSLFFYVFNFNFALTVSTCHDCRRLLFLASFFSSSFSLMKIVCKHLLWFSPMLLCCVFDLARWKLLFYRWFPTRIYAEEGNCFLEFFFLLSFSHFERFCQLSNDTPVRNTTVVVSRRHNAMHNRELSVLSFIAAPGGNEFQNP